MAAVFLCIAILLTSIILRHVINDPDNSLKLILAGLNSFMLLYLV